MSLFICTYGARACSTLGLSALGSTGRGTMHVDGCKCGLFLNIAPRHWHKHKHNVTNFCTVPDNYVYHLCGNTLSYGHYISSTVGVMGMAQLLKIYIMSISRLTSPPVVSLFSPPLPHRLFTPVPIDDIDAQCPLIALIPPWREVVHNIHVVEELHTAPLIG